MVGDLESLSEETWDVVIAGTSLPQSLLALALSKCGLKVLHVDANEYYGGIDAGLSLDEAQKWVHVAQGDIRREEGAEDDLRSSRSYTISLRPQIIYARSRFLPSLVSSQVHTQLEFQAVGPFWIHADGRLQKIPSNREDVFADDSLSVRDKRRLMGLLRHVLEEPEDRIGSFETASLEQKLRDQFKILDHLKPAVQALTLSTDTLACTDFEVALNRLKRHLTSMGYFGPGLAAVMAKYGGNAEIAQVACRAGAVGGFVYLLGHGVKSVRMPHEAVNLIEVELSEGTKVKTKHLAGTQQDLPPQVMPTLNEDAQAAVVQKVARQVSIISQPLRHLFVAASESSPVPAVAIIIVGDLDASSPPVYLQVHSEDTGECPPGQSVVYASTVCKDESDPHARLFDAITSVVGTSLEEDSAKVLWTMSYTLRELPTTQRASTVQTVITSVDGKSFVFPPRTHDIAFDDHVLDDVKVVWETILGDRSGDFDFLRFEERRDNDDE